MTVQRPSVVDIHAHLFPHGLPNPADRDGDPRWPVLVPDGDTATVLVAGKVTRRASRALWDVEERVRALDSAGVDLQVVSPVPVTLVPWASTRAAARWSEELNDRLAEAAAKSAGRLLGLGSVPIGPEPGSISAAVAEAKRIRDRGLAGVELATVPGGRELDDPELDPFWAAADELELPILVHPTDARAVRRSGQPYEFGIGMLTDTALAGTALVFGGVLARFPRLRIALCHGCGALPWTYARTLHVAAGRPGVEGEAADALLRRLWTDTLVFDPEHLRLVAGQVGIEHVMLGTDDPMVPGRLAVAEPEVRAAVEAGAVDESALPGVLGGNALRFLGIGDAR